MSAQRRVPMPTRRKFGSTRFVPAGILGILLGRTSSPEQANDRRRDANIWYGVEPALRRVGTDRTPFSFDPEIHATARIRPFRSNLCGHYGTGEGIVNTDAGFFIASNIFPAPANPSALRILY